MDNPPNQNPAFHPGRTPADQGGRRKRGRAIHIRDLFQILWNKKILILLSLVVVVAITAVYTLKSPKLYRATTRLVIEKETLNLFLPFKNLFSVDTTTSDYYNTQYKILKSRTLAQNVIRVLGLKVTGRSGTERPMYYLELLSKTIVSPLRDTRLVDVSVVDEDARRAATIANTVAQEFIKLNVTSKLEARKDAAQTIGKELEEFASQVREAEQRFNEFKRRQNIVSIDEDKSLIQKNLTALTDAASQAMRERTEAESVYNRIKDLPQEELRKQKEIANDVIIQKLEGDYQATLRMLTAISRRYGDRHPKVRDQKALVEGIRQDIVGRVEAAREVLKNAWEAAKRRESEAAQSVEEAVRKFHEFNTIATEYRAYQMEGENKKKTYEELLRRSMESDVFTRATRTPTEYGGQATSNIRVIDKAVPPGACFRPRPLLNLSLAVFLGLALGCGAAFFVVYLDDKVRNPDDVTEDLGRPLLAEIPVTRGKFKSERARRRIAYEFPDSVVSEAYRNLRASLQLMTRDGGFPSLVVTSACHGEGKTTTAVNLGIIVAQTGRKVLLVDTDMRRPRIHHHFGISESTGLARYLSGEASLEDALVDRSDLAKPRQTRDQPVGLDTGQLWVLPCGERRVFNSSEILGSQRMQELIAELKSRFDVLIFDSPPCRFSDPLILAKMVEGVLVVVEAGRFPKSLISQGLENLDRIEGNKVLGVILNKYDPKRSGSYGFYGYRNYYYHRYYDRHYYSRGPDRCRGGWRRLLYRKARAKPTSSKQKTSASSISEDKTDTKSA